MVAVVRRGRWGQQVYFSKYLSLFVLTVPTYKSVSFVCYRERSISSGFSGLERFEWNETTRGRSFHSKLFGSILIFQAEQPTRTENNPTDICGGNVQLDQKTGGPSRGQRVFLTQKMAFPANVPQGKPQSRRCKPSKSHLWGKSRSYDVAIAARQRLLKFL